MRSLLVRVQSQGSLRGGPTDSGGSPIRCGFGAHPRARSGIRAYRWPPVSETVSPEPAAAAAAATPRKPAILAVDDEPAVLAAVARDLRRGFGDRYRILRAGSGPQALELLRELRTRGDQVALLIADQRMPGMAGTE